MATPPRQYAPFAAPAFSRGADCGATFSEPGRAAFRKMSVAAKAKGLDAIADVTMRRLFTPEFQAQNPDL